MTTVAVLHRHSDPTEGTIFPFPNSHPKETTKISLDLAIPIHKTREQRIAEETERELRKQQQREKEQEEEKRKKQQEQENADHHDALEESINDLTKHDASHDETDQNNNSSTLGTFSSISISKFESPVNSPTRSKLQTDSNDVEKEETVPLWAIDNLGFFLITKESEGSQPYAPSNHKFEEKFLKILQSSRNNVSGKHDNNNTCSVPAATAHIKCSVLADAVKQKIDWWKIRARELDASAVVHALNGDSVLSSSSLTVDDDHESTRKHGASASSPSSPRPENQLSNWRRILLHEIRVRVRRDGVTPAERCVAWPLLGGLEYDRAARLERCMRHLETRSIDAEMRDVMLRDLGRTLPTHVLFRGVGSLGQTRLERVLVCYCALDPEVGYCQGMGFIVAVLLLHMPEADAFGLFVQMMQSKRYQMRALFQSGFPLLQRMLELFRRLLRLVLPQLMEHFDNLGIDPAFFASHWFLTLFSYQFSVPVVCRIWDLFLSEGWVWIYRVAIALLLSDQETLMAMTMEDILMHVKLIHEGKSDDEILRLAKQVAIRESDLVALESEYLDVDENGKGKSNSEGNDRAEQVVGDSQGEFNVNRTTTRRFP